MTDYSQKSQWIRDGSLGHRLISWLAAIFPYLALASIPVLYLLTLAHYVVFGDPTEYTFVANILGIAHPPGYAFITLLGKLFQTLVPFNDIPWRMHLLSATGAFASALFVFATIRVLADELTLISQTQAKVIAAFGALVVATATDFWQHAIHANPHIITAAFLSANLFLLTKWWSGQRHSNSSAGDQALAAPVHSDRWLLIFAFSAGLGVTHHPLTVFTFPAYVLFILWVRPRIWRDWRLLLKMVALAMLGLAVWLYYPIRSAMGPAFGPHDMNTLHGFLDHILARGLTESLPFFGLVDQPDRALVFWSLLRLQYALPIILLALFGLPWLMIQRLQTRPAGKPTPFALGLFYTAVAVCNYAFVISLRQQDIMAYLLGIFLLIGLLAGAGLLGLVDLAQRRLRLEGPAVALLLSAVFLLGPVLQVARNLPSISLQDYAEAQRYADEVFDWFEASGEGAVLLNDWEHMTPLWYTQFVEDSWPSPDDVRPRLVSTDRPWVASVFDFLPGGPVYLSGYRPEIIAAGFRLRPRGPFYQVVEPGEDSIPPELVRLPVMAGPVEFLAYQLPGDKVQAGGFVPFTLAMRSPEGTGDYYTPVLRVGPAEDPLVFEFTTDSHLTTPLWQPGEVIIERFDFALPHDLPGGSYPLTLGLRNLTTSEELEVALPLGLLEVGGQAHPIKPSNLLANFRQRVGLRAATARNGLLDRRQAPWQEPLPATPGDTIHLKLEWESLALPEESYTVFVHLIDLANRPLVALDYTPLGGSAPTHLWIPKWLPGQKLADPYRLEIPVDIEPGTYLVEVGLYEMTAGRRLHMSDPAGNLIGDRYILGSVEISP